MSIVARTCPAFPQHHQAPSLSHRHAAHGAFEIAALLLRRYFNSCKILIRLIGLRTRDGSRIRTSYAGAAPSPPKRLRLRRRSRRNSYVCMSSLYDLRRYRVSRAVINQRLSYRQALRQPRESRQ